MVTHDRHNLPGMTDALESQESAVKWAGERGETLARSIPFTIDKAAADPSNTPDATLVAGLVMAMNAGATKIVPYVAGSDQEIKGILTESVSMMQIYERADKSYKLATGGLMRINEVRNLDEYAKGILTRMGCDFNDRGATGAAMGDAWIRKYVTDDVTLTAADSGKRILMRNAASKAVTLPTIAAGLKYQIYDMTASDVVITGAANIMSTTTGYPHTTLTITDIGAGVEVFAEYVDAAGLLNWMVKVLNGTATAA